MLLVVTLSLPTCTLNKSLPPTRTNATAGIQLAKQEIKRGQYRSALGLLDEARFAAEESEERCEIALLQGDCHLSLGQASEATNAYFRARSANESKNKSITYAVSMGLGKSFESQNRWTAAERHYQEAVSFTQDPRLQDKALLRLGVGSLKNGRLDRATTYHSKIHDQNVFGFGDFDRDLKAEQKRRGTSNARPNKITMPTVLAPEIMKRHIWKASPIRPGGNPTRMEKPWRMTIHHAASPDIPPTGMADAASQMRSYQKFHQTERGWADLGYHYVIDGAGRIWEGREMRWQGAHAGNNKLNKGNIGICLMGNFVKREPTPSQKKALKQLLSWLCEIHRIHPHFVTSHRLILRDTPGKSTVCPGAKLEAYLNRLKPFLPRP